MDYSSDARWLTPDPLGGDVMNPQSFNRYAYVNNNPATLTDPLGLYVSGGPEPCDDLFFFLTNAECGPGSPLNDYGFPPIPVFVGGPLGAPSPPPPPVPPGQPPMGGMGNAMFGGLVTCTNAQAG